MSADAPRWPPGAVRALLETDTVTEKTRATLGARLAERYASAPRFFSEGEFATLHAACARLIPQEPAGVVPVAEALDARLADGDGNGWRYDALPPDGAAYRLGLRGLDEGAHERYGAPFAELDGGRRDHVLAALQRGEAEGGVWDALPAARWFEELLADAVEVFYSHPLAQESIGYVGMADRPGWTRIGLGELEGREPRPA